MYADFTDFSQCTYIDKFTIGIVYCQNIIHKIYHNEWSEPRKRLSDKGIINTRIRGQISICLPRMIEFIEKYTYEDV